MPLYIHVVLMCIVDRHENLKLFPYLDWAFRLASDLADVLQAQACSLIHRFYLVLPRVLKLLQAFYAYLAPNFAKCGNLMP